MPLIIPKQLWSLALEEKPDSESIPFLCKDSLQMKSHAAGLSDDQTEILSAFRNRLCADEPLLDMTWFTYWRVFKKPELGPASDLPDFTEQLGADAGLPYLLIALEFVTELRKYHSSLGYPSEVTEATLQQVSSYATNHLRGTGTHGIYASQCAWLSTYLTQPYVRLGRLEFQLHPFEGGIQVWRHKRSSHILPLIDPGMIMDAEGTCILPDSSGQDEWITFLDEQADKVNGIPIHPEGYAVRHKAILTKNEWEKNLSRGDWILDIHVPAGGEMGPEKIVSSLHAALDFFSQHHSDQYPKAFILSTWFMDPKLQNILTSDSNPVRFQRMGWLYPKYMGLGSLWFVFLSKISKERIALLPETTSLQHKMKKHLLESGNWKGGGFLLLEEDARRLGPNGPFSLREQYLSNWKYVIQNHIIKEPL